MSGKAFSALTVAMVVLYVKVFVLDSPGPPPLPPPPETMDLIGSSVASSPPPLAMDGASRIPTGDVPLPPPPAAVRPPNASSTWDLPRPKARNPRHPGPLHVAQGGRVHIPQVSAATVTEIAVRHFTSTVVQQHVFRRCGIEYFPERHDAPRRNNGTTIFDVFSFQEEIDLVEIRIGELLDAVDKFVVVEGSHTFTGGRKELNWEWMSSQLPCRFVEKTRYYHCGALSGGDNWGRERSHRECQVQAMAFYGMASGDVVHFSDADEFPARKAFHYIRDLVNSAPGVCVNGVIQTGSDAFRALRDARFPVGVYYDMYNYNFRVQNQQHPWNTVFFLYAPGTAFERHRVPTKHDVRLGGWHCSWCFRSAEGYVKKFTTFSHSELLREKALTHAHFEECACRAKNIYEHSHLPYKMRMMTFEESWQRAPPYLKAHLDRFPYLLFKDGECRLPEHDP